MEKETPLGAAPSGTPSGLSHTLVSFDMDENLHLLEDLRPIDHAIIRSLIDPFIDQSLRPSPGDVLHQRNAEALRRRMKKG